MSFTTKDLKQTATLWEVDGNDAWGDPAFSSASPQTVTVRWEERTERFMGPDGTERIARGVIYLSQDITEGDYLFLGTSVEADPRDERNAFIVRDFKKVPNIAGDVFERKAMV